jgi:SAM-dependent methyltransferase
VSKTSLKSSDYLKVTYSEERAPYGEYPLLFAKHLIAKHYKRPGKILDLGCGRGDYLKVFRDLGLESYGTDISPEAPNFVENIPVVVADLENDELPFPEIKFDFVFSKSVIEHMRDPMRLLKYSYQQLKQEGTAVILTPSWEHNYKGAFYIDHTHVTPFTRTSLEDALKIAGYENVNVYYFYQLPILWKFPWLKIFSKLLSYLPIPYNPLNKVPWSVSNKLNKHIRFSKEVMLLAVAKK